MTLSACGESSRCSAGAWLSAPVCLEELPLLTRSETVFLRQRYILDTCSRHPDLWCDRLFVAEMLIEKNFRVFHKKRVGEWAVLTVVLAAFLGALKLDLFRIEGKIPDVSEVKVVSLNLDYKLCYTEPDDIQKIIDFQKEILAQKEECLSAENQYYLSITYTLKGW